MRVLSLLAALVLLTACEPQSSAEVASPVSVPEPADLVFLNGGIYTVNAEREWAQAAAVRDGKFLVVGSNSDVEPLIGPSTRQVDLSGKMMLPGFHDSHVHPDYGGKALLGCDLADATDADAIVQTIANCLETSPPGWLQGFDFDLSIFDQNGPHKSLLDDIAPDRPIVLWASDGHNAWVNSAALEAAGITADTPDPEFGVIEREADGSPSGTLRETAQELVRAELPEATSEKLAEEIHAGIEHLNSLGITSFIDAMAGEMNYLAYQSIETDDRLSARVRTCLVFESGFTRHKGEEFERVLSARSGFESDRVNHDCIKLFLDGVLEGETAAVLQDYLGLHHKGELILSPAQLAEAITRFDAMGLQVHMHAIGDRAVRTGLDAVKAASETNGVSDNRHHISHLQMIHVDDIERFQALNVTANFQAAWAYPDEYIMELNLPVVGEERVQGMYPIASVERAGGRIVGGSDWSVSTADPLYAIETAMRRQEASAIDGLVLNEKERVTLATMIDAYTINGAWLMHQEDRTGSIEVGKQADIVILDQNLFEIPVTEIDQAQVLETLLDGQTIYRLQ